MKFKLRDYQQDLVNQVFEHIKTTEVGKGIMVQSQAGSGKTVMMADVAKHFTDKKAKVLFLVHRTEIIQQAEKTFMEYGVNAEYANFSMINTYHNQLFKKHEDFDPDVIFIDEGHHCMSPTYQKVLKYYQQKAIKNNKPIYEMFFTATPYRLDGKDFLQFVQPDNLILGLTTKELIERHNLAPFQYYEPSRLDASVLKRNGKTGDYTSESMAEAVKNISPKDLVRTYQKYCKNGEQALIYASTVELSKKYAKAFNDAGIKAYHLDGSSSSKEREEVISKYRQNKVKVLSNVELFTEGLDLPNASVAFLVRPTQSLSLYIQFSMRVLRYQEGKTAKIFDYAGLHDTFGLPDTDYHWSLQAENPMETAEVGKTKKCPYCNYIFELLPNQARLKSIKCPNCSKEVILINPKKDSPFDEYYDEDISEQEQMINSFNELEHGKINFNLEIDPHLPFYENYQLAQYKLSFPNDTPKTILQKLLRTFKVPVYPTYFELSKTVEVSKGALSEQEITKAVENNNKILKRLLESKQNLSVNYPIYKNFAIAEKKITSVKGAFKQSEVIQYVFDKMQKLNFREYFGLFIAPYSVKQLLDLIKYDHTSENIKLITDYRKKLYSFFLNQPAPLGRVFTAQITDVTCNERTSNFTIYFKDYYGKKYHQVVLPVTVAKIIPYQDKDKIQQKDGYLVLKGQYIKVLPQRDKETNQIRFKFALPY